MKTAFPWSRPEYGGACDKATGASGVLTEPEFRRILEYERALADRHERFFSLLVLSAAEDRKARKFDTALLDLIKRRVRLSDVVGWVEKHCIGIILPSTDHEGARLLADDLCEELLSNQFKAHGEVHTYPGEGAVAPAAYKRVEFRPTAVYDRDLSDGSRDRMMSLLVPPVPRYKRVLDIAISMGGLTLAAPLMAALAAAIKLVSPGPVFFKQERIGHLGSTFICWKFRTMHVAVETETHRNYFSGLMETDVPMTKLDTGKDARLIPFGKFIRASGLDELPQLYNVLRGEMSFVGPRPCIQYEYDQYERWHKRRFDALPGLTGLWQVSGKNRTTFSQMMRLDVAYARTLSLRRDLVIVWRTFPVLVEQVQFLVAQRTAQHQQLAENANALGSVSGSPIQGSAITAHAV